MPLPRNWPGCSGVSATMSSSESAIVVERLCKRYGTLLAVDDVSFAVAKGELFAFLGPNGAGKTTTVEVIQTSRPATSGRVMVLGMDVARQKSEVVKRIGVLPQGFSSFDRLTVRETLQYYAKIFSSRIDINTLMDLTDLRGKAEVQFKTLSGGLKQRVGIAAALVNDPEVVFLDEPTTGLDPHARREVWEALKGLKSRGKTIFLTTHYMEEAEFLADTVAIIAKGRIIAVGSPTGLTERHADHLRLTLKMRHPRAPGEGDRESMRSAPEIVRSMGFRSAAASDDAICVPVDSAEDVRRILAELHAAGVEMRDIDVRKPNLEEVFLKLTGDAAVATVNRASAAGVAI